MKTKRWMILLGMLMSVVLGLAGCNATNNALEQQAISQTEAPTTVVTSTTQIETPTMVVTSTTQTELPIPTDIEGQNDLIKPSELATPIASQREKTEVEVIDAFPNEPEKIALCDFTFEKHTLVEEEFESPMFSDPELLLTDHGEVDVVEWLPDSKRVLLYADPGRKGRSAFTLDVTTGITESYIVGDGRFAPVWIDSYQGIALIDSWSSSEGPFLAFAKNNQEEASLGLPFVATGSNSSFANGSIFIQGLGMFRKAVFKFPAASRGDRSASVTPITNRAVYTRPDEGDRYGYYEEQTEMSVSPDGKWLFQDNNLTQFDGEYLLNVATGRDCALNYQQFGDHDNLNNNMWSVWSHNSELLVSIAGSDSTRGINDWYGISLIYPQKNLFAFLQLRIPVSNIFASLEPGYVDVELSPDDKYAVVHFTLKDDPDEEADVTRGGWILIDIEHHKQKKLFESGIYTYGNYLKWSPDGKFIVYQCNLHDICIISVNE